MFTGQDTSGNLNGYELSLPVGGAWQLESF